MNDSIINLRPGEMPPYYGHGWRLLPKIYASCSLSGDPKYRDLTQERHEAWARLFAPAAILVSPLRGAGLKNPGRDPSSELSWQEIHTRDLRDVREARVVLLDLEPQTLTMYVAEHVETGRRRLVRFPIDCGPGEMPSPIETEAVMNGSLVEIWEAHRAGIPVIGINAHKRARQTKSAWFEPWITKMFNEPSDGIKYIVQNLLI